MVYNLLVRWMRINEAVTSAIDLTNQTLVLFVWYLTKFILAVSYMNN